MRLSIDLFRQEVLGRSNDRLGTVVPWSLPRVQLWAAALICWLVVVATSLAQMEYADKISVDGVVRPSVRPAAVTSATTGTVKVVHVKAQQQVSAGDALLLIDKRSHARLGQPHTQLQIDQLQARKLTLAEARQRFVSLHAQQQALSGQRLTGLLAQRRTLAEHLGLLKQRVALALEQRRKIVRLADQDWVSDSDVSRSEAGLLLAQEASLELKRRQQVLQLESDEVRGSMKLRTSETNNRLSKFAADARQLDHEIVKAAAADEVLIVAPIAGRVVDLTVHVGKQLVPGTPLLTLSPHSAAAHHVEVQLPSQAAGRVRAGMPVRLRYSGYPFQEYGTGRGEIATVSEVNVQLGARVVFRAEVTVLELPAGIDYTPAGMSVSADILLAQRPLWAWFAKPLAAALQRL